MDITTRNAIGTCMWAGHRFLSTDGTRPAYCPTCEPVETVSYGRPWVQRSAVKWAAVKATVTATKCSEVCTSAKRDKCSCECGGENHGAALGQVI